MQASSSTPLSRGSSPPFPGDDSSDEEDMDWEEVALPAADDTAAPLIGPSQPIEITLDAAKKKVQPTKKMSGMSHAERVLRLETHKIHTVCLIANGLIRNKYLNDRLLHARLMSLTPLALQNSFAQIHKKRVPDVARRGRMFEAAVMRLSQWWTEAFFDTDPRGGGEIQSRTFDEVEAALLNGGDMDEEAREVIRTCKSLQKHALLRNGSRDVSAQLFTALCRALGVPARLVVSVQSVPWKASVGKPKQAKDSRKGKGKAEDSEQEEEMEEVNIPSDYKGKGKAIFPGEGRTLNDTTPPKAKGTEKSKPVIKLRKQRPKGRTLASMKRSPGPPLGGYPPAQWTEVFSRPDGQWISVDPVRGFVNKPKMFEPPRHDRRNRMVYVLAFEEDGWARDVTQRYARAFANKTSKIRVGGKGKKEWWEKVMACLTRPYRLHRDDLEDAELQSRQIIEGMPTSVSAFKDHPLYVLERHLLRDETLHPRTEIGRFRGEPVFSRADVVSGLKTAENWMRTGRVVAPGEQPMKWVKVHAVTVGRRRALGVAGEVDKSGDAGTQGLYAETQTELYSPPPVVDGQVPKNDFGNIDLYVDSMLPSGGVHIPYKGVAKIARELRFDYAEAVTGFEFKNRHAFPVITGIVIAAENESALLEAYWASAQDAEEKERIKREERVLKRWTRLVQGLRIRKRLQEQYSDRPPEQHGVDNREDVLVPEAGGFLLETADNVVQAYSLPKALHLPVAGSSEDPTGGEADVVTFEAESVRLPLGDELEDGKEEAEMEEVVAIPAPNSLGAPKTMQQLAEEKATVGSSGQTTPDVANGSARESRPPRRAAVQARKRARGSGGSVEEKDMLPKRGRTTETTPTPTRTLRARVPKSEEKKQKERELEAAFRRAIAE